MSAPVYIEAIGTALPTEYWSSQDIEQKLDPLYQRLKLPHGRIELMTGIQTRGYFSASTLPSAIATQAAVNLFDAHSVDPSTVDMLIYGGVCRDQLEPATAAAVHADLKLPKNTSFFDLSNACLGVIDAIRIAKMLIESGAHKRILVVTGENARPLIENTITTLLKQGITRKSLKPYFANLTLGSGGAAVLVSSEPQTNNPVGKIDAITLLTDSPSNQLCQGGVESNGQLGMKTDAEALLNAGISLAKECWEHFNNHNPSLGAQTQLVIQHQVGRQHQRLIYESLRIEESLDYSTYSKLGNTGSASIPLTLADAHHNDKLAQQGQIQLLGIGSGLTAAVMSLSR